MDIQLVVIDGFEPIQQLIETLIGSKAARIPLHINSVRIPPSPPRRRL
jgi:hypothetical protein